MGASGERLIGATEACPPLFPYQVRTHLRSNRCPRVHATQHRPQPRMQRSALGRTYCMGRHDGPGDAGASARREENAQQKVSGPSYAYIRRTILARTDANRAANHPMTYASDLVTHRTCASMPDSCAWRGDWL